MSDFVSVVLATYNTARFLRAAIESVLEQTHRNLELIIVDDGSTDGTRDIVETFLADPRVRYFYQANAGQPAADNLGISKAAGPFIAFIDADDVWSVDKLEKQMPLFTGGERIGVVYSPIVRINEHSVRINAHYVPRYGGRITERLFVHNFVPFSTTVVRRECLDRVGVFDPTLRGSYDYDLWLRVSTEFDFALLPEATVYYREWPGQMSHRFRTFYECGIHVMRRFEASHTGILSASTRREAWASTYAGRAYCIRKYERTPMPALLDYARALCAHPAYVPAWKGIVETLTWTLSREFSQLRQTASGSPSS